VSKILNPQGSLFLGEQDTFFYSVLFITLLVFSEGIKEYFPQIKFMGHPSALYDTSYIVLIVFIFFLGVFDGGPFIYFQF
jgi:hypothetical protein